MLALLVTLAVVTTSSIEDAPTPARFFDSTLACYDAARTSGESLAVDGVYQLSKSTDMAMARDAVDVLGRLATPSARAALAVVLCGSEDPGLRARAADWLGDASDRDAIFVLALDADLETNPEVLDVVLYDLARAAAAVPDLALSTAQAPPGSNRHEGVISRSDARTPPSSLRNTSSRLRPEARRRQRTRSGR